MLPLPTSSPISALCELLQFSSDSQRGHVGLFQLLTIVHTAEQHKAPQGCAIPERCYQRNRSQWRFPANGLPEQCRYGLPRLKSRGIPRQRIHPHRIIVQGGDDRIAIRRPTKRTRCIRLAKNLRKHPTITAGYFSRLIPQPPRQQRKQHSSICRNPPHAGAGTTPVRRRHFRCWQRPSHWGATGPNQQGPTS